MLRSLIAFSLLITLQPACVRSEAVGEWALVGEAGGAAVAQTDSGFATLVAKLSEPGGYFDSDNLVSNELSYEHVLGAMRRLKVTGGAYIGVGPDQNYTYIAKVRPKIAYMIDLRRDNLLQHLLYKSLFEMSRNRAEYLALLLARPVPANIAAWDRRGIDQIITYLDSVAPRRELYDSLRTAVAKKAGSYGIPLDARDLETIARIHGRFAASGLDLQYESLNRPSRRNYPTFRELILERDLDGNQANYFVSEDDFQFVKSLHAKNLIVPVVGNLAGPHALRAIGRDIAARGEHLSALYVSNVEFYLMREGGFEAFAENAKTLPRNERSVIIRSYFNGPYTYGHPQWIPGYFSTQILQTMESLVTEYAKGGYPSYLDLVTKHSLPLR
jgi:hypothetical protein